MECVPSKAQEPGPQQGSIPPTFSPVVLHSSPCAEYTSRPMPCTRRVPPLQVQANRTLQFFAPCYFHRLYAVETYRTLCTVLPSGADFYPTEAVQSWQRREAAPPRVV